MIFKCLLFIFATASLHCAGWTPPATIPALSSPSISSVNVFGVYNDSTGQLFAAWQDTTDYPYFSTYTPLGGWAAPAPISSSVKVNTTGDVFLAYNSDTGQVFASFASLPNAYPTVVIYTPGSGWGAPVNIVNSTLVNDDVILCYNPHDQQMFAGWVDFNNSNAPTFSIYSSGSWGPLQTFPYQGFENVSLACDPSTGEVLAAWEYEHFSRTPTYVIYDQISGWGSPNTIVNMDIASTINLAYNAQAQAIFAVFASSPSGLPYSIPYSLTTSSWGNVTQLASSAVYRNIWIASDETTGQVFATWLDNNTNNPFYNLYNPASGWLPNGAQITSSSLGYWDCTLAYASGFDSMFAFWRDLNTANPTWSLYFTPPPPQSPSGFTGVQKVNDFGTESEIFIVLTWSAPPSSLVDGYYLYQNGNLIATLGPNTFRYQLNNIPNNSINTFTLIAFNSTGDSPPVTVTLH